MQLDNRTLMLGGGILVVAAATAYMIKKMQAPGAASAAGTAVGTAVVDAANGVATGAVTAIGEAVGIPKTDLDQCYADMAAGRTWDASFSCPAPIFLRYLANGQQPPERSATSGGAHGAY